MRSRRLPMPAAVAAVVVAGQLGHVYVTGFSWLDDDVRRPECEESQGGLRPWLLRSRDGGRSFGPRRWIPMQLCKGETSSRLLQNPVSRTLLFLAGYEPQLRRSHDKGRTWETDRAGAAATGPVAYSDQGVLVAASQAGPTGCDLRLRTSSDDGVRWTAGALMESNVFHCPIAESLRVGPDGQAYAAWAEGSTLPPRQQAFLSSRRVG